MTARNGKQDRGERKARQVITGAWGVIQSTGEQVLFVLEEARLRFFSQVTPQMEGTPDTLFYLRVNEPVQRIRFLWGPEGIVIGCNDDL